MNSFLSPLLLLAVAGAPQCFAEIDSGGGKSSGAGILVHSSIGEPFATVVTQADPTVHHPGLVEVLYPITPSSISDVNGNGLPDGWEVANFGPIGVDPEADPDQDGTTNLMEYLSGTDPNNPKSVFRPQGSFIDGIYKMPIQTVAGRNYQVWVSRDLKSWHLQQTLGGDGTLKTFEFDETTITEGPLFSPEHPSRYFFRVQILIP